MSKPRVRSVKVPLTTMIKNFASETSNSPQSAGLWAGTDRLDSWKEIASYLRREVRTVQLWEKREGLPVHRHFHKRLGSVYALRSEVEIWKRRVSRTGVDQETKPAAPSKVANLTTIYVLPLTNVTVKSERRRICDAIATKTIAALQTSNPEKLCIVSPKFPVQDGQSELPASTLDEQIHYVLRWSVQDE